MELNITVSNSFSWKEVNWDALRRLRNKFLSFEGSSNQSGDYWSSEQELASYDFTFGERIGWKWDTVLAELKARGWSPPPGNYLDYGCGTGVAGRRVVSAWPDQVRTLFLWDRSSSAMQFARKRASASFPALPLESRVPERAPEVLVISHVLNELDSAGLEKLLALAAKATVILWVEPGTADASRRLIQVRKQLLADVRSKERAPFKPIAPCPHALECGLLAAGNERHWCHHFAKVPSAIFQDAGWGRFSKTLEVDLRAIPFSYLVLDRREGATGEGNTRVIGHPRHYKGFDKVLSCQMEGVQELVLQKRDDPDLHKEMKKDPGSLYQWECEGGKIRGGKRIF